MPPALLDARKISFDNKINDDAGSGAQKNLFTWKPVLRPGWYYVGPVATNNSEPPIGLVIKDLSTDGSLLRPVGDWIKVWDDAGSGKPTGSSLWRGIPQTGQDDYLVIGGFFTRGHDKPTAEQTEGIRAIHKSVVRAVEAGSEVWNDAGTGATKQGAVWSIDIDNFVDSLNPFIFIPVEGHNKKPLKDIYAIDYTKVHHF